MIQALEAGERSVPRYLVDAVDELRPRRTERAALGMSCYWSGEACLGRLPGVLSSRTGFLGGSEVVDVLFDPGVISYGDLVREAHQRGCADRVFSRNGAQRSIAEQVFGDAVAPNDAPLREAGRNDQKYYLLRSGSRHLVLTPRQAVRVNAALAAGLDPAPHLSPRQRSVRQ